jgi:branched-chain amino acid transport system ATP-binding protein
MPMLSVESIEASYGQVKVLRGLSMRVPKGSVVALLGGNGAGKTTLMRAIVGLITARAGAIMLDGEPIQQLPTHKIFTRGVALVPQGRELFPEMTVSENLEIGMLSSSNSGRKRELIEETFNLFPRLRERATSRAAALSGGEQQMLAMGRALASKPRLLLLDEPTTGLAPIIVKELQRIITTLNAAGLTILVVEQNTQLALNVARHVYVIRHGEIVMDRPRKDIADSDQMFKAYLG